MNPFKVRNPSNEKVLEIAKGCPLPNVIALVGARDRKGWVDSFVHPGALFWTLSTMSGVWVPPMQWRVFICELGAEAVGTNISKRKRHPCMLPITYAKRYIAKDAAVTATMLMNAVDKAAETKAESPPLLSNTILTAEFAATYALTGDPLHAAMVASFAHLSQVPLQQRFNEWFQVRT